MSFRGGFFKIISQQSNAFFDEIIGCDHRIEHTNRTTSTFAGWIKVGAREDYEGERLDKETLESVEMALRARRDHYSK